MTKAYCGSCKKKKEVKGAKSVKTSTGQRAIRGKCTKCGSSIFSFGSLKK